MEPFASVTGMRKKQPSTTTEKIHCGWISMVFHKRPAHRGRLDHAATRWSPAVLHWSLCVFWCTGPECDVISLLRQKRRACSPPSGHWLLTWTRGAVCVIITLHVLFLQAQLCITCPNRGRRLFKELGPERTGEEGPEASAPVKTCRPQWTRTTMKSASSPSFSEL